ncbi:efflux RND transporter periplasmic adaptor subunit [Pseudogemmobacter bohemicus]|uniref:efflux RND transporter periplasmic adaptor subunit n=1 Tax=Pseudogemmobacter bohemicus TaxID=2250708 RepID=UPI001300918F|nr:efflux RND transporter periplasmic adaptor subunit [Pseudogemmobacter bohemicus]
MKRRTLIAGFAALALAGGLGWAVLGSSTPASLPVSARTSTGTVVKSVLATGMLEAKELVSVGARVSGQIETLAVSLGQPVKAGDLIAQIDSQDQQNNVLQAEAALANIAAQISAKEATLNRAELALARQQKLGSQSYASQEAVETAEADVLVYKADLESLRAQKSSAGVTLATARNALERTKITAPISGTIVAVVVKQGQTVNSAQSAPTIVKIADLSTMLVKVEISEADVMNVEPGQSAGFTTLGAPGETFTAYMAEIEPAPAAIADSDTISSDSAIYYNGLLEVANPEGRLRIGMSAEVSIELDRADGVLVVPSSAVKTDAAGSYVEILDRPDGSPERRDVSVGLNNKITAEIRDGLREGDMVVTGTEVAPATTSGQDRMGGPPPMF